MPPQVFLGLSSPRRLGASDLSVSTQGPRFLNQPLVHYFPSPPVSFPRPAAQPAYLNPPAWSSSFLRHPPPAVSKSANLGVSTETLRSHSNPGLRHSLFPTVQHPLAGRRQSVLCSARAAPSSMLGRRPPYPPAARPETWRTPVVMSASSQSPFRWSIYPDASIRYVDLRAPDDTCSSVVTTGPDSTRGEAAPPDLSFGARLEPAALATSVPVERGRIKHQARQRSPVQGAARSGGIGLRRFQCRSRAKRLQQIRDSVQDTNACTSRIETKLESLKERLDQIAAPLVERQLSFAGTKSGSNTPAEKQPLLGGRPEQFSLISAGGDTLSDGCFAGRSRSSDTLYDNVGVASRDIVSELASLARLAGEVQRSALRVQKVLMSDAADRPSREASPSTASGEVDCAP
eukprot:Gregarina_sp_Poly_1__1332@NODE_132_length_13232_cov_209_776377_g118_i0_p6_GENE_NODE_132_length_13232_cov_209_776377_g118_i0NODE_132_length_13232_cov_209_776377_g118_i0_p6_ORF_typecomplete_len403_score52_22_NODE_132_length_13232_cov_209_776377_g118_i035464754